jgi:sRNA-binding regulator protein Hfq
MAHKRRQRIRRNPKTGRPPKHSEFKERADPGSTGSEAAYLKSLVDSRATVTVVLKTGERLRGRIRYYDRDCFSLGPSEGGPKIFLRKDSVSYIAGGVKAGAVKS